MGLWALCFHGKWEVTNSLCQVHDGLEQLRFECGQQKVELSTWLFVIYVVYSDYVRFAMDILSIVSLMI